MPESHGNTLRTFLEDPSRPPGTLTYHELQGFLFAVASAPDAAMLMTLSFFASKKLAEAYCAEAGGRELRETATSIRRVFPNALAGYARLGRSIQQVVAEVERSELRQPQRRKTGRNQLCPCGSGRKYKKCCGGQA